MWSKGEAKALRQQFWTVFGQYMAPVPSAEGEKINWINYRTGNKAVRLKLLEEKGLLQTMILLDNTDADLAATIWDKMQLYKEDLSTNADCRWQWDNDQKTISSALVGVHVLQQAHWPQAIAFFKQSLVAADAWWCSLKYNLPNTNLDF